MLSSLHCLLKVDFRPSDRINDPPLKVWICIIKKYGVIKPAHCDCVGGTLIGETVARETFASPKIREIREINFRGLTNRKNFAR